MLTLLFRLAPAEWRTVARALRAARAMCDYPSRSPGALLEYVAIDFRAGRIIYCAERAPGEREPYWVRLHPERLQMIEEALHAARRAGAPDDSTALLWVCATFLYHRAGDAAASAAVEQRGAYAPARGANRPSGGGPERVEKAETDTETGSSSPTPSISRIISPTPPIRCLCFPRRPVTDTGSAPHRVRPGARRSTSGQVPQGPPSASKPGYPEEGGGGQASFAELDQDWLRSFSTRVDSMYRPGWVPKRDGRGVRSILKPGSILRAVQRLILDELLAPRVDTPIGYGHSEERDAFAAARAHARRRPRVLGVGDIENFFPSITVDRVAQALVNAGIEPELAETLALICTREGALPQGSPASPAIASLILPDADRWVFDAAKAHGCRVTRYCDDFGVSGDDRNAVEAVVAFIAEQVAKVGLHLNPAKSRIVDRRSPMVYLGLEVGHGRLSVPKGYRARVDSEVHRAALCGADRKTRDRLLGEVAYVSRVHPREGHKLFTRLRGAPLKQETTAMEKKPYVMDPKKRGVVELAEPRPPGAGTKLMPDGRTVREFVEEEAGRVKGLTIPLDFDFDGEVSPFTDPLDEEE